MISPTNYDFQWGRSEVVIIYPDVLDWTGEFRPQPVASGMTVSVQWLYSYLWSAKN